jgi:hypothetical protein
LQALQQRGTLAKPVLNLAHLESLVSSFGSNTQVPQHLRQHLMQALVLLSKAPQ